MRQLFAVVLLLMILLSAVNAKENEAKILCIKEIKKEQPNKKYITKYCTLAGEYYQSKKNDPSASWYYLLGGQNSKNINEIQNNITNSYTYRNIGHSYVLKGELHKVKRLYSIFLKKSAVHWADKGVQENYKLLNKLYPEEKRNLNQGLALWNDIYAPLKSVKTLYANFEKAAKEKKYKEAIKYLTQVIALQKQYQDKNNISLWGNLFELGILYNQNEQYKKSLEIFQQVESVYETRLANNKRFNYLFWWIADDYKKLKKYDDAIKYYKKLLSIQQKISEKEILNIALIYVDLGLIYRATGDYLKALEHSKKALVIKEKVLGKEHPDTVASYSNIGLLYQDMGDYPKAMEYTQKSLTIIEKVLGKEHPITAKINNDIGGIYQSIGDYYKALNYYHKSLSIRIKVLGKEHLHTATSYSNIGTVYGNLGDYPKALEYYKKSLDIQEKIPRKENSYIAVSYGNIGALYGDMGDYHRALKYQQKSIDIQEKVLGKEHRDTAASYRDIGVIYRSMGDYHKAMSYYQKSLAIREKVLGKEHPDTAIIYNDIGVLYGQMGNYTKSLNYKQKSLVIQEKVLGKEHPHTAASYSNIGTVYGNLGDYPKALEYFKKSLVIQEKILGKEHPSTAVSHSNIGWLYHSMGDYRKALNYYQKSLAIREKVLGKEHPNTALSYSTIGELYRLMGDYTKSLGYHQKSLAIREKVQGKEHPDTAQSYNNIGLLYDSMGDYRKALSYYQKSLPIAEKVLGKEHRDTAASYRNIGAIYDSLGIYPIALSYYQKSLAIQEKVLGREHPETAVGYYHLAWLHQTIGDYPKAHHYAKLSFDNFLKNRDQVFTILDSLQKEKYLKTSSGIIESLLDSSNKYLSKLNKENKTIKAQEILQSSTNAWFNYKGSIFDSENAIAMLYRTTRDRNLKAKIDDLVTSKRYLAKLYQSLPKPKERGRWKKSIEDTEAKIAALTNQIATKATNFKEQQGLQSITYKDITSHLKEDELYIDYARTKENYYLFSLNHKETISFTQIDKNSTKKIDKLVKTFKEDITAILNDNKITEEKLKALTESSKEKLSKLYELVLNKPLAEQLKTKKSLIISPDGALRLLPFEALYDKTNQKYFIEEKEIRYIPSGKELIRLNKYSKDKITNKENAVIFANPNFNTKIASVAKEQIAITPNTNRSGIIKSLFRMHFSPLPGTKAEAKAIKATLKKEHILEYQQNKATESNLMQVKEPRILHIATHGFFINDKTIPNPMLKSGIALAGANNSKIRGKSDGIVTALKLSGLDLKGTDLVVLSACETGVVDINATDSVSGLSKAFIQAGAKDIVMSLWSVDDQATKELMSSFYQEIKRNKHYAQALKAAKLKMIKENRHPFFWAAFVVSGL